ncbi:MAG: hypothetical protein HDS11_04025 [Bacteroides sp.]|nr:hypothetical protein [Bacteroides sp.]
MNKLSTFGLRVWQNTHGVLVIATTISLIICIAFLFRFLSKPVRQADWEEVDKHPFKYYGILGGSALISLILVVATVNLAFHIYNEHINFTYGLGDKYYIKKKEPVKKYAKVSDGYLVETKDGKQRAYYTDLSMKNIVIEVNSFNPKGPKAFTLKYIPRKEYADIPGQCKDDHTFYLNEKVTNVKKIQ